MQITESGVHTVLTGEVYAAEACDISIESVRNNYTNAAICTFVTDRAGTTFRKFFLRGRNPERRSRLFS
jgi:hypothetical protein